MDAVLLQQVDDSCHVTAGRCACRVEPNASAVGEARSELCRQAPRCALGEVELTDCVALCSVCSPLPRSQLVSYLALCTRDRSGSAQGPVLTSMARAGSGNREQQKLPGNEQHDKNRPFGRAGGAQCAPRSPVCWAQILGGGNSEVITGHDKERYCTSAAVTEKNVRSRSRVGHPTAPASVLSRGKALLAAARQASSGGHNTHQRTRCYKCVERTFLPWQCQWHLAVLPGALSMRDSAAPKPQS